MTLTVVILGAGWVGCGLAHKLLQGTLPKVPELKVVLVTPNTHFYWNPAAVRAILPGGVMENKLFMPIEPGFARYSSQHFEFVLGTATALDPAANAVTVRTAGEGADRILNYDHVVIATGSSMVAPNMPFKLLDTFDITKSRLHELQSEVEAAKTIVIAGGGTTGVETAAELGERYGKVKTITLVASGPRLLDGIVGPNTARTAEDGLKKLKVNVITGVKVEGEPSGTTLKLSDGRSLEADLYLPLFGIKPNTKFLPASMVGKSGDLHVEPTLQVADHVNIWAAGDVVDVESKQIVAAEPQTAHLAHNLHAVLTNTGELKPYIKARKMVAVTLGNGGGTGEIAGIRLFGFMVTMSKSKNFFSHKMSPLVNGT